MNRKRFNLVLIVLIILPILLLTIPLSLHKRLKTATISFLKWPTRAMGIFHLRARNPISRGSQANIGPHISAQELMIENERLKALLDFKKALPYRTIPCRVIGRDPSNWTSTMLLDKGGLDGIKVDSPVVDAKGLIGRVIELTATVSKVMLITDYDSRVVSLVQSTRDVGVLCGINRNVCKMKYLPLDSAVKPGDNIISSGLGGVYPKGLAVGRVIEVKKEIDGLSLYLIVKPSSRLEKVEEVLVITK